MSEHKFSVVPGRALKDTKVTDSIYRTLSALCMYADKNGWCWPSQGTLAEDIGKTRKTVNEHLQFLEEAGYIVSEHRSLPDGSPTSKRYQVIYDQITQPMSTPDYSDPEYPRGYTNDPLNDPKNDKGVGSKPDLVDGILHFAEKEQAEKKATRQFENAFGFGSLPWHSGTKWDKFRKFVVQIHATDPTAFGEYVIWRAGDGKYKAMSNKQIRTSPDVFIDTGWPEFLAENQSDGTHSKFEGV